MVRLLVAAALALAAPLLVAGDAAADAQAATNAFRSRNGVAPCAYSPSMGARAAAHSRAMAARGQIYHGSLGGGVYAENVAMGGRGGAATVNMWIGSSGHRRNLLSSHPCCAVGFSGSYATQMFGTCSDAHAPARAPAPAPAPAPKHWRHHAPAPAPAPAPKKHYKEPEPKKYYHEEPVYKYEDKYEHEDEHKYEHEDEHEYGSKTYGLDERCMGAPHHKAVPYHPCAKGLVCVAMPPLGWGKFCVPPRYHGDHDEKYDEVNPEAPGYDDAEPKHKHYHHTMAPTTAAPKYYHPKHTMAPTTAAPKKHYHHHHHKHYPKHAMAPVTATPKKSAYKY